MQIVSNASAISQSKVQPVGDEAIEVVSGENVYWSADSSSLVLVIARHGRQEVASVTVPGGRCRKRRIGSASAAAGTSVQSVAAFTACTFG